MATEVILPRLGQGMESGTIVRWLKSEGEPVEKGEPLFELDTDKVTQEVESDFSGVLLKIAVSEGEVPVGTTIAVIGEKGEEVAAEAPAPAPSGNGAAGAEKPAEAPKREPEREEGRAALPQAARPSARPPGELPPRQQAHRSRPGHPRAPPTRPRPGRR